MDDLVLLKKSRGKSNHESVLKNTFNPSLDLHVHSNVKAKQKNRELNHSFDSMSQIDDTSDDDSNKDAKSHNFSVFFNPLSPFRSKKRYTIVEPIGKGGFAIVFKAFEVPISNDDNGNDNVKKVQDIQKWNHSNTSHQHKHENINTNMIEKDCNDEMKYHNENYIQSTVAVKQLLEKRKFIAKDVYRFLHEALIMSRIDHPHCLKMISCIFPLPYENQSIPDTKSNQHSICNQKKDMNDGKVKKPCGGDVQSQEYQIITEIVDRGDLFELLHGDKNASDKIGIDCKYRIATELASAVRYLHDLGLVHRDLKSLNVLLTKDYHVKLCDFTFCKEESKIKRAIQRGTPRWMAPETLKGQRFTKASDVYSYGIIVLELITEEKPFHQYDPLQLMEGLKSGTLKPHLPTVECLMNRFSHTHTEKAVKLYEKLLWIVRNCCYSDPSKRMSMEQVEITLNE